MSSNLVDNIDGQYIAGEVALLRVSEPDKACLLVEGIDDFLVYKRLISLEHCQLINSYGKENLLPAIEILNRDSSIEGYLAIKDADFDIINGTTLPENVVLTDGHDLEVMILNSIVLDRVIEIRLKTIDEVILNTIVNEIRTKLFEIGSMIGYLRWISIQHAWGLDINTFKLLKQLSSDCNLPFVISVQALSDLHPTIDKTKCSLKEYKRLYKTHSLHLCNGHELIYILTVIIPQIIKKHINKKINLGGEIRDRIFLAYDYLEFQTTKLYQAIRYWEKTHTPFFILPI